MGHKTNIQHQLPSYVFAMNNWELEFETQIIIELKIIKYKL